MAILPQPYNTRLEAISRTTQDGFLTLVGGVLTLAAPSGVGNVSGPASSTTNAIPVYSDTTGKVIKNSGVTIDSTNKVTAPSYQVGTGIVARHYSSAALGDTWSLRTADLANYGKAILGSGTKIASNHSGSVGTPGKNVLTFASSSSAIENHETSAFGQLDGTIEFWNYNFNNTFRDLVFWANPHGNTRDKSNYTQDVVLRGQSGNVEIKRGRLILDNGVTVTGSILQSHTLVTNGQAGNILANKYTSSSGFNYGFIINSTVEQSGTSANVDLRISRTETSSGTGIQRFIECNVNTALRFYVSNTGEVVLGSALRFDQGTGPRIKNDSGIVNFRNAADSADAGITAGAATFSGLVSANAGIAWSSSQTITNPASQISLTSTNSGAAGGVRVLITNDAGVSGQLATYGSASTSSGLANKVLVSSTGTLRIASSSSSQSGGSDNIEVSPGGYNRVSAIFHPGGKLELINTASNPLAFSVTNDNPGASALLDGYNATSTKHYNLGIWVHRYSGIGSSTDFGTSFLFNARYTVGNTVTQIVRGESSNTVQPVRWTASLGRLAAFEVLTSSPGEPGTQITEWDSRLFVHRVLGFVGINNNNPTHTLSVSGDIQSSGYVSSGFQTLTSDPVLADIPTNQSRLIFNSTTNELRTWTNVGGVLYKSEAHALA